jgi:NAD(P)H-dependent FMN reductase
LSSDSRPNEPEPGIRVVVILGSVRPGNYTGKAAALVVDEFRKRGVEVEVVDPAKVDLRAPGM